MAQKRILILEDEAVIRTLCSRLLAKETFKVSFAETVGDALQKISSEPIDLLITDLKLPDGSGIEAIRQVHEKSPTTKIIVMTGSLSPEQRLDQVRDLNVMDIIYKPFDIKDFEAALKKAF